MVLQYLNVFASKIQILDTNNAFYTEPSIGIRWVQLERGDRLIDTSAHGGRIEKFSAYESYVII